MARAPWAIPNKESGNGNDSVSWTASPHTGRGPEDADGLRGKRKLHHLKSRGNKEKIDAKTTGFNPYDIVADFLGCFLGVVIISLIVA